MVIMAYSAPVSVILFFGLSIALFVIVYARTDDTEIHLKMMKELCTARRLTCELAYLTKLYEMYILSEIGIK
jgi:hypothetical protein